MIKKIELKSIYILYIQSILTFKIGWMTFFVWIFFLLLLLFFWPVHVVSKSINEIQCPLTNVILVLDPRYAIYRNSSNFPTIKNYPFLVNLISGKMTNYAVFLPSLLSISTKS
jgi:hypothetical protein